MSRVAAVVIGRNEGARLVACLASLKGEVERVVYVDSGSRDDSVAAARAAGAQIVELDLSLPFTAARARNAGFEALRESADGLPEFVQLVDGDCRVEAGWIAEAEAALAADETLGMVTGWRREIAPETSVYNALCDVEWHRPEGEILACGGDMMVRATAFTKVSGFNPTVIAAEDDEFCTRLRKSGFKLWRLPEQMTIHDAAMTRLAQWWRRAIRSGHGFAQVGCLHPEYFLPERRRVWLYGAALPALALVGLIFSCWLVALAALAYLISYFRTVQGLLKHPLPLHTALHHSLFLSLSKLPNLLGMLTFHLRRWRGRDMRLIEYK